MAIFSKSSMPSRLSRKGYVLSDYSLNLQLFLLLKYFNNKVEKVLTKLQEGRTIKKIVQLDDHIHMAYSELTADGRILANKVRV